VFRGVYHPLAAALLPATMPQRQGVTTLKLRTLAAGLTAAAALALPASAMADTTAAQPSLLDSLSGPAHIDGHTYSAAQMKHRYHGQKLFFVLGSREEGIGAVAAFHSSAAAKAYARRHHEMLPAHAARAAYNPGVTAFYRDAFLEGPEIDVANNSALGNLAQNCMISYFPFTCSVSWDNQISSAKTGSDGAYLYNYPYLNTSGGYVYIAATDSVEVWRFFNDVASSVFVP
jgi:hypothetical protein